MEKGFELNGIEVTIFEAMGKATIFEASSLEKQGIEPTIFEAMGKTMILVAKGMELFFEAMGK